MILNRPLLLDGVRLGLFCNWSLVAIGWECHTKPHAADPFGQRISFSLFFGPLRLSAEVNKSQWRWL